MASSRIIVASLLLLLLLLAFAATSEARIAPGLFPFQQTCDQVRFKKMCESLTRLPKVKTPQELLLASMRVAAAKAKAAKIRVDEYAARSNGGGKPMDSALSTCSTGYDNVVQTLEETQQMVLTHKGTPADMNTKLSDAVTSADDCTNAFQDFPDLESPFLAMQKNVFRLVDNVLNIDAVIEKPGNAH